MSDLNTPVAQCAEQNLFLDGCNAIGGALEQIRQGNVLDVAATFYAALSESIPADVRAGMVAGFVCEAINHNWQPQDQVPDFDFINDGLKVEMNIAPDGKSMDSDQAYAALKPELVRLAPLFESYCSDEHNFHILAGMIHDLSSGKGLSA